MDGTSLTPETGKPEALQRLLPEAFSEGKVDLEVNEIGGSSHDDKQEHDELVLLPGKTTQEIIDAVIVRKPTKVIPLDKLYIGSYRLKTI